MKELRFRNLTKDEVEVRIGAGGTLLLYKTARVDANILDEVVGCFNWQKRFYQVKNTMICEIGINVNYDDPTKEPLWVFKGDAGDESQTEAIKGEASDSFKRAGFAWGIGRSLYTAPKIKLPDQFKNTKFFDVSELEYNSKNEISKLTITTDFGSTVVYQYPKNRNYSPKTEKPQQSPTQVDDSSDDENAPIREEEKQWLQEYVGQLGGEAYNSFFDWLEKIFKTRKISELTASEGIVVVNKIKNRKK